MVTKTGMFCKATGGLQKWVKPVFYAKGGRWKFEDG
jgi:hypothetical protein